MSTESQVHNAIRIKLVSAKVRDGSMLWSTSFGWASCNFLNRMSKNYVVIRRRFEATTRLVVDNVRHYG